MPPKTAKDESEAKAPPVAPVDPTPEPEPAPIKDEPREAFYARMIH